MIELRWVYRKPNVDGPEQGLIPIGNSEQRIWQVLQYRNKETVYVGHGPEPKWGESWMWEEKWSEWKDVPFEG